MEQHLSTVSLEVVVKLGRVTDVAVDDRARKTVLAPVLIFLALREDANVVALPDHNDRDLGVDAQCATRL